MNTKDYANLPARTDDFEKKWMCPEKVKISQGTMVQHFVDKKN